MMLTVSDYKKLKYEDIPLEEYWNDCQEAELSMHTIHAYPAKFPAFIASKAFEYARQEGVEVSRVADIFCGCGTVALESKVRNVDFWGCDINPVATLIARVKSNSYETNTLKEYFRAISEYDSQIELADDVYLQANPRLHYWFTDKSYRELLKLYLSIEKCVEDEKYREAYYCVFSAILKACSRWLTKSIKPQVDPRKKEIDVFERFRFQYTKFLKAVEEMAPYSGHTDIVCADFLSTGHLPEVDLIITSPPYVTSYEYADLHQLSSLWLGYTDDYRKLREGSIGSTHISDDRSANFEGLNETGKDTVNQLLSKGNVTVKVRSIARYYSDMQKAVEKCSRMLRPGGMVFFVIGDSQYKDVKLQNARHLIESLQNNGYQDIKIAKRTVSKGICVPYRDRKGKFSADKSGPKVYHEEYIISGRL